jgi:FkbH-like protein
MYDIERRAADAACCKPPGLGGDYTCAQEITAGSFLVWGEHCVECAAPSCFQSCDLYSERPNGLCRRFISGIVRNRAFPSIRGYGAQVSFKKWGKLESRGNTAMMTRRQLLFLEGVIERLTPALDFLGMVAYRMTANPEWRAVTIRALERLGRWLHPRARREQMPDAFLLEVFNPGTSLVALHVVMDLARRRSNTPTTLDAVALLPSYRKRIELPPGYSRHELPAAEFSPVTESGLAFDIALVPEGDTEPTLIFLSADFVSFRKEPVVASKPHSDLPAIKCVVWDLDNTVWDGILLEDEFVRPKRAALEVIRTLDKRGVLSSVASKNDLALALDKMKEIGIEEYILFPQIGWSPKSQGIKAIAEKLNIGVDTFMFIDDNQFELDEVARALPMVACVNARDVAKLVHHPRLQGSTTAEAQRRRAMYREAMTREQQEHKFGDDFFGFLRSCQIKLRLIKYTPEYFDRVCELVQRTNQLNFSGRKYKREEVLPVLDDDRLEKWVLECSDKFGSYGVVGFGIVSRRETEIRIEDFMLSCRVQGRFVEQAFFHELAGRYGPYQRISVNYQDTGRNTPAQQVLLTIGFVPLAEGGMALDLQEKDLACDFIDIECDVAGARRELQPVGV